MARRLAAAGVGLIVLAVQSAGADELIAGEGGAAAMPGHADFYIAPDGDDANPGSRARPFATLARARDAARQKRKDQPNAGEVAIRLRGGTYFVPAAVTLDPSDSNTRFVAEPGETPVFTGAGRLTGRWAKEAAGPVWTRQLPAGTWFTDLYAGDQRQPRSRVPAEGFLKARNGEKSRTTFGFGKAELPALPWPDAASATAIVRPYQWCEFNLPVKAIDAEAATISLGKPAGYAIMPPGYGARGEFAVENVRAGILAPGQWSLDRATGVLNWWPPEGVEPVKADLRGASTTVLISLTGDAKAGQWVENVSFEGLTFTQTARTERTEWGPFEGSAVRFNQGVRGSRLERCRFADLGGGGVVFWKQVARCSIRRCTFERVGETGVVISDYLGEGPPLSERNEVTDCEFTRCGQVRRNALAVEMSMTAGNTVAHNHVHDMPYIGIRLSGTLAQNWQAKWSPAIKPPFMPEKVKPLIPSRGNTVAFNRIERTMQEMGDGGAIYFWGTMGGPNTIANNLIDDVGKPGELAVGLYLDDETDEVTVRDNMVLNANWGLHLHGAPRDIVENNIFVGCRIRDISIQPERYNTPPMHSVIRRSIFAFGRGKMFPDWVDWTRQPIGEMNRNVYWRGPDAPVDLARDRKGPAWAAFDTDSIVADPKFIDPAHPEKGLAPDSPAIQLGFEPIDLSKVGPRPEVKP